jgi:hypothetical protein
MLHSASTWERYIDKTDRNNTVLHITEWFNVAQNRGT